MAEVTPIRDLSCGMQVNVATATAFIDYRGRRYYFCSRHCADVFAVDPEKFLRRPAPSNPYRIAGQ